MQEINVVLIVLLTVYSNLPYFLKGRDDLLMCIFIELSWNQACEFCFFIPHVSSQLSGVLFAYVDIFSIDLWRKTLT